MNITKEQTLTIKAIAIFFIIIHNFLNVAYNFPIKYNEFEYHSNFLKTFITFYQTHSLSAILIALGYLGVHLFVFISAYGLTKRYENNIPSYTSYLKQRIWKVYKPYILSFPLFFLTAYISLSLGNKETFSDYISDNTLNIISHIFLVQNFFGDKYTFGLVGPWWFISLIVQFYLVFPFLLKITKNKNYPYIFLLLGIFSIISSFYINHHFKDFNAFYILIGWLPVVLFGIYTAKKDIRAIYLLPTSFLIVIASYFNEYAWYISFIPFTYTLVYFILKIKPYKILLYIGSISMYLFFVHGIIKFFFNEIYLYTKNIGEDILYFVIYLILTVALSLFLKFLNNLKFKRE